MKICNNCKKEFKQTSNSQRFCSKECLNIFYLKKKVCKVCGKEFEHRTRGTCSEKCYFKLAGKNALKTNLILGTYKKLGKLRKGKTYKEQYGKDKSLKISKKMSVSRINNFKNGKIKLNSGNWGEGHVPWNKDKKGSQKSKRKGIKDVDFYGVEKAANISRRISETVTNLHIKGIYKNSHHGERYKGNYMKSSWEIKVAKWLDKNNIKWEYESKNCRFKRPNGHHYIVDFYLPDLNKYIEVKGWWDKDSINKCKDFINKKGTASLIIIDEYNINNIALDVLFCEYTPEFICGVDRQVKEMRI